MPAPGEVDLPQHFRHGPVFGRAAGKLLRRRRRRVDAALRDVPVELAGDPLAELVRKAHFGMQFAIEARVLAFAAGQPAEKADAAAVEVVQAERVAAVPARQMRVCPEAHLGAFQHVRGPVEIAHVALPGDAVPPPPAPWQTAGAADREPDIAARPVQLLGDLAAGLPGADDQDAARRQHVRALVVVGGKLLQAARQAFGNGRDMRRLVCARRHDDIARAVNVLACLHLESVARTPHRQHLDPAAHRRAEGRRPALEMAHQFVSLEEAVRVAARIFGARQRDRPVRRDGAERIPPAFAPA